jgi:hypothetical protein
LRETLAGLLDRAGALVRSVGHRKPEWLPAIAAADLLVGDRRCADSLCGRV